MNHLTLDPCIPLALWAPLALAVAMLLGWYAVAGRRRLPARRWWAMIALMAVAAAIPLAILLNPTWLEQMPLPAGKPLLTILIDRSASMATRDAENDQTRYQAAVSLATIAAQRLSDRYEVRLRTFAETSSPASIESLSKQQPDGATTDLAAALQESLVDDRPQGQAMWLLSDGIHNSGGIEQLRQSAAKAKSMAAPVYAQTIGGPASVNDLEVGLQQPQELAFVGQRVPVAVSVRQRGSAAAKTVLSLLLGGKSVARRDVALKPDAVVEEVFYVSHEQSGLYRYEAHAEPLPAEAVTVNNTAPMVLRVVDQPIRVLLLEGKPYWDTKFLVRTLSADPAIELTSVVRLAEGRLLQRNIPRPAPAAEKSAPQSAAAKRADPPKTEEPWTIEKEAGKFLSHDGGLAPYQIVILGRDAEVFLTDDGLVKLRKWLAEGEGSLVCFRGPPASKIGRRLGELMPLRWTPAAESRFRVQLTDVGQALRWLPIADDGQDPLGGLPSLATTTRPEAPKTLAVVLATGVAGNSGDAGPVMIYQPVGNGRVVVVEGAGMWRWAFLPPELQRHQEVYASLWKSLVRWLVVNAGLLPSQRLALRADKLTFRTDENVTATLLVRDRLGKPPQVELAGESLEHPRDFVCTPSGSDPGQYHLALGRLPEGRFSLRVLGAGRNDASGMAAFDVRGNLAERLDVRAQPQVMTLIAEESGGATLESNALHLLAQYFDQHLGRTRPQRTTRTMAWDHWWVLVGAFVIWGAAWSVRRRSGLV